MYLSDIDDIRYDYLIVGAGLYGSVFAYEMNRIGKKCLVIDKRDHIGGNCYIFHTNNRDIWNWINQFAEFNNYKHSGKVIYEDKLYSFPINLMTLNQIWGIKTPEEAKIKISEVSIPCDNPSNFEEWILSKIGQDIYEIFIKGYTMKQWDRHPKDLPSSIVKRLPIRLNFNDNYYFDRYQGIPIGGYTQIFQKLLTGIEVRLNTDYFDNKEYFDSIATKIVYTGKIDEFFNYKFGELEYRSLRFENEKIEIDDFQGCAIVNYTSYNIPYTRITEHKHFENSESSCTWISKEYSTNYIRHEIPFYPINDEKNNKIYDQYKELSEQYSNIIFGGRLAEYKYYDMHQIIDSALSKVKNEIKEWI